MIIYKENGCYDGEVNTRNKPHGHGTFIYSSGSVYEGEWKWGKKEGKGTFIFSNGERYEGMWHGDVMQGYGKYFWDDGSVYEGQFRDGVIDGKGTITWEDGESYSGYFVKEKKCGKGTHIYPNGDRYVGGVVGNKYYGEGAFYQADTDVTYKGFWTDVDTAYSVTEIKNGKRRRGTYIKDMFIPYPKGYKTVINDHGARYVGEVVNGKMHGYGTLTYGSFCYVGEWRNDDPCGNGILYYPLGNRYEGQFVAGHPHGKGTLYFDDGDVFVGEFAEGMRCGHGTLYRYDGQLSYEGEWHGSNAYGVTETYNGKKQKGNIINLEFIPENYYEKERN